MTTLRELARLPPYVHLDQDTFRSAVWRFPGDFRCRQDPTSIPVDPGSPWSVTPNPLTGSTRSERWYSNQTLSGTASNEMFEHFSFQHQYYLTMKMVPEGVGSIAPESGWQNGGEMVKI